MLDKNKLKIFKANINLNNHANLIKGGIKKTLELIQKQTIFTQVLSQFKRLWKSIDEYKHNNDIHRIVYLSALIIQTIILFYEKKIEKWLYELKNDWFDYLFKRTYPYLDDFSNQILNELHSDYPFGDIEIYKTVAERIVFNIKRCNYSEENYQKYLFNEEIEPWARILQFENHYRFEYALFIIRCAYFGEEMSKFEGKDYQRKLTSIFQLYEKNKITPKSDHIKNHLIRLQNIRNAISHPERAGIRYLEKTHKIKFMNYNPQKKEYNWVEEASLRELWNIGYVLTTLDRTFIDVALSLSLLRKK